MVDRRPPLRLLTRRRVLEHGPAFRHPFEIEEAGKAGRSAELTHAAAELGVGGKLAYTFDFGDERRVLLTVTAVEPADDGGYPRILPGEGDPPPQYAPLEDDEPLRAEAF